MFRVLGIYNFAFIVSQVLILDPDLDNLISWARSNERNSYKQANSKVEYFRLMSLNIYKNHMKLEDKRAKRRAFLFQRKPVPARNTQRNPMLKEPSYNQINVEFQRKFVRPYNFKRGRRRRFFLFAEDRDLARNPKSACPLCKPIKK